MAEQVEAHSACFLLCLDTGQHSYDLFQGCTTVTMNFHDPTVLSLLLLPRVDKRETIPSVDYNGIEVGGKTLG